MSKIQIINLTKTIKHNKVINNINITLKSGEIIGFKGINGSGKTMLMRLICGLIKPTSGKIIIDGKELGREISFPQSIGVLIENPAFLDGYNGLDNLKILASIKKEIKEDKIRQALESVGLKADDTKKYKHYSLGMKQRLGIAGAIMESPDIVILDEPTNAIDSDGVQMVKDILEKERNRGALIILACHDYEVLKFLCDEIYTIQEGSVVAHDLEV